MDLHRNYVAGEWREGTEAAPDINPSNTDQWFIGAGIAIRTGTR